MSDTHTGQADQPTTEFLLLTQQLLEHLHDFPYLIAHQFPGLLDSQERLKSGNELVLRTIVLKAIESLSPNHNVSFRAPHGRLYNMLQLHYVEGMTIVEAARELNISVRQAYRDLRRGEESVAAILWMRQRENRHAHDSAISSASRPADEHSQLHQHDEPVDVRQLVSHAQQAVEQLARNRAVSFTATLPTYPVIVFGDAVVAQQLIVSCMSRAVQMTDAGRVDVSVVSSEIGARINVRYELTLNGQLPDLDEMIQKLTEQLGWPPPSYNLAERMVEVGINIPASGVVLLVIDDNTSITDLFERYLASQPVHFLRAATGEIGLSMAQQIHPDAIILDIMMPVIDGWQLLQTLRTDPLTNTIPIIVCSVISDPELAYSLGATHILNKPVSRDMLLAVLDQLNLT